MNFSDLNIVVGSAASVQNEVSGESGGVSQRRLRKSVLNDRRKNTQDRRKSVREGIFVSLSLGKDRRILRDRRKAH